jgi:hypothetical protein
MQGIDAGFFEGLEFAGLAFAVLVEVAPDAQFGEAGIRCVDEAVAVGVFLRQRSKKKGRSPIFSAIVISNDLLFIPPSSFQTQDHLPR